MDEGHSRGHHVTQVWLDPPAQIHPGVRGAIAKFDAVMIGPGSFFTSLMPTLLVDGVADGLAAVKGPIVLVANLLTEGQGMQGFTAADAAEWVGRTIGRPVDVDDRQHRASVGRRAGAIRGRAQASAADRPAAAGHRSGHG